MTVIKDIEKLFSQLVDDPKALMKAMEEGSDVLSGSRAANFFANGLCNSSSDWDFYCRCCNPDDTKSKCKLYMYFENIGCNWSDVELKYNDQVLNVYTGILNSTKVQLIVYRLEDMIDGILGFHSTVPQCIVAYDSAFCAYYDLLSAYKGVEWTTKLIKKTDPEPGIPNNERVAAKYINRGISLVTYAEYAKILGGNIPDPRVRKSGDDSSSLLKDSDTCSLDNISWLECAEGCVMLSS